jgi:cysteine desulfurase
MIYLDNAATTPLDKRVFDEMTPYFLEQFGNPSSTHALGRQVKVAIEEARKSIAKQLNCLASEIFFTSCATEANNTIVKGVVDRYGIEHIITSKLEHHAVLHPIEDLEKRKVIVKHLVKNDMKGKLDLVHFEELISQFPNALVSIMHANNELGNINPVNEIASLCKKHNAYFHSDTVQSIGHLVLDLALFPIDYLVASAHKFHGPKGIGFMFVRKERRFSPLLLGGSQEKDLRAGTENVAGIIGMERAFVLAHQTLEKDESQIRNLKEYFIVEVLKRFDFITVNGTLDTSLNNIISLAIAPEKTSTMLLFSLDLKGICVSGGSACGSGAVTSHITEAISLDPAIGILRVSLSRFNTRDELKRLLEVLEEVFQ